MPETPVRRRPQEVVDVELRLTRRAIVVCGQLVKVALDERLALLDDGWPPEHVLCEALDQVALRWAGERDHQRRALRKLTAEAGITEEEPSDA